MQHITQSPFSILNTVAIVDLLHDRSNVQTITKPIVYSEQAAAAVAATSGDDTSCEMFRVSCDVNCMTVSIVDAWLGLGR